MPSRDAPGPPRLPSHLPSDLPSRPWVRDDVPLVWRSDTCVEIGFPPRQVRVDNVDHAHVTWLLGLQGDRDLAHAMSAGTADGLHASHMRRLLLAGTRTGLVDDAAAIPESLRDKPVHVRDLVAGDVAAARHVHGGTLRARDVIDQRRLAEVAVQGGGPVADVVALVLTSAGIGNVVQDQALHSASKRHRRGALDRACHVLCGSAHPDAAADPDAMALDIPHLTVTATGAQATVGPLVIPGRTSCLRCRDLHRADADDAWPRAAVQWARRRPGPVAAGLAHLAGAWASLQVLALIDAGPADARVPTMDGALLVSLPDAVIRWEARPPHPLCGCLWPATGSGRGARAR